MNPKLQTYAHRMRRDPTRAEALLYSALLNTFEPYDVQVKCQEPVSYFIADFMIYPFRIVIEVDGGYHTVPKQVAYDKRRDTAMRRLGIKVIRISNERLFRERETVIKEILEACGPLSPKRVKTDVVTVTKCPPAWADGHRKATAYEFRNFSVRRR